MLNTGVKHDLEEFKVAQNSRNTKIELTSSENLRTVSHRLDEAMTMIKKLEIELKNTKDILDITQKIYEKKLRYLTEVMLTQKLSIFTMGFQTRKLLQGSLSLTDCYLPRLKTDIILLVVNLLCLKMVFIIFSSNIILTVPQVLSPKYMLTEQQNQEQVRLQLLG